jgi:hypothetical protein
MNTKYKFENYLTAGIRNTLPPRTPRRTVRMVQRKAVWRLSEGGRIPSQIRRLYFSQVLEAVLIAPIDPLAP